MVTFNGDYSIPPTSAKASSYLTEPFAGAVPAGGGGSVLPVAGAVLWVDGQDATNGFQTSGGFITTWTDKSTGGHTVTADPNILVVATLGGFQTAAGFGNGALSSGMFTVTPAIPSGVSNSTGFTIFAVTYPLMALTAAAMLYATYRVNADVNILFFDNNGIVWGREGNLGTTVGTVVTTSALTLNALSVWSYRGDPAGALTLQRTGETAKTGAYVSDSGGGAANITNIGNWLNGGTYFPFQGGIAELIVYPTPLSDSDILLVRAYLNTKYGTGT